MFLAKRCVRLSERRGGGSGVESIRGIRTCAKRAHMAHVRFSGRHIIVLSLEEGQPRSPSLDARLVRTQHGVAIHEGRIPDLRCELDERPKLSQPAIG